MATNRGNDEDSRTSATSSLVGMATGLGFSMLIFVAGGVLLDNLFHTAPILTLVGVFFAIASIGVFLWRIVQASGSKP